MLFSSSDSLHLSVHHFLQFKEEGTTCSYSETTYLYVAQAPPLSHTIIMKDVREAREDPRNEASLQLNSVYIHCKNT